MTVPRPAAIALAWLMLWAGAVPALAQDAAAPEARPDAKAAPASQPTHALPADSTTHHTLDLRDRALAFTATAGSIRLFNLQGAPQADIAYVAYRLDADAPAQRPVTFVVNGGPGASSAWLHLGALGPWRLPIGDGAIRPSADPRVIPNPDTWLDFTDLVFIDPVGTGYSRAVGGSEDVRKRFWSVEGDIQSLGAFIRRWLQQTGRITSPKYIAGESYGGFRGPRLVRALQSEQGIGVWGMVLVSPALDLNERAAALDPMSAAGRLPSMVAAARGFRADVSRDALADAEAYAASDYLLDLIRGPGDPQAVARIAQHVAALTGLDPDLIRRHHGRLSRDAFLRALAPEGRVASVYDAVTTGLDPFPSAARRPRPDPVLDALIAPVTSAMLALYTGTLDWQPSGRVYELLNRDAARQWDWGGGRAGPESLTSLRTAMALDPRLRLLVAHGLYDLVTPYFATALMLRQVPLPAGGDRIRFVAYPGGHMFYRLDASRLALRIEARAMMEAR